MNQAILESGWVLEGAAVGGAPLRLLVADSALQHHGLGICVGRDPALCELVIADPAVSHRQFRLSRQGRQLMVEDLNSLNGTQLEQPRPEPQDRPAVTELDPFRPTPLGAGATLTVGRTRLLLRRVDA